MPTVTISLPETLKDFVETQIATKGYGNVSEHFRSLLRAAQEREQDERPQTLLLQGLASGDPLPADEAFWHALRSEAAQRARAYKGGK